MKRARSGLSNKETYRKPRRLDPLTPEQRSERMSRIRNKNTKSELAVRHLLHSLGYRYRLHVRDLPGTPDIVFRSHKKVIFVHGCFWHLHARCRNNRPPKTKQDFWLPKLEGNKKRDLRNRRALARLGWKVFVVWECWLEDEGSLVERLRHFLEEA